MAGEEAREAADRLPRCLALAHAPLDGGDRRGAVCCTGGGGDQPNRDVASLLTVSCLHVEVPRPEPARGKGRRVPSAIDRLGGEADEAPRLPQRNGQVSLAQVDHAVLRRVLEVEQAAQGVRSFPAARLNSLQETLGIVVVLRPRSAPKGLAARRVRSGDSCQNRKGSRDARGFRERRLGGDEISRFEELARVREPCRGLRRPAPLCSRRCYRSAPSRMVATGTPNRSIA